MKIGILDIGTDKISCFITNIVKEPIRIPYFNTDGIEVYQESGELMIHEFHL